MRIIEARDGFIKFETNENLGISSFVKIEGEDKNYIAQVIQVKDCRTVKMAYAKLLFLYDGTFTNYDKTLPVISSEVTPFPFGLVCANFDYKKPIVAGKFIDNESAIPLDIEYFNNKTLISFDDFKANNIVLSNLAKQFAALGNVVVIDMLGNIKGGKYTAGKDFKLPLNTESLEFLYEDCLNDATSDSKDLIKDIFQDLSEYSKSVPFLPFGTLKTIIDDMVEKSHIFKLLVLKNKLAKFDKQGYFASKANEADNLTKILNQKATVIDISKMDMAFQNRYLSVIYSEIEKLNPKPQVFIEVSNSISKKNIKNIVMNESIKSVFLTHSKFKYLKEIKNLFDNFIIESTSANKEIFNIYTPFLNSMNQDEYLIVGKGTNYIPLLAKNIELDIKDLSLQSVAESIQEEQTEEEEDNTDNKEITEEFVPLELDEVEKDEQTEAIEKRTDVLIEEVSGNIDTISDENIFDNEDISENESNETLPEINERPELEPLPEFHTEVDSTKAIDLTEELEEVDDNNEIATEETVVTETTDTYDTEDNENNEQTVENADIINNENPEIIIEPDEPAEEPLDNIQDDTTISEEISESNIIQEDLPEEISESNTTPEELPEVIAEPEVIELNDDSDFDEIVELDDSEIEDTDIIVDIDDGTDDMIQESYDNTDDLLTEEPEINPVEQEIIEDVDKVFTTMKEDTISDSDLDFIDELNDIDSELTIEEDSDKTLEEAFGDELISSDGTVEELEELPVEDDIENEFLQPLEEVSDSAVQTDNNEVLETREGSTPMVPVYEAEIPEEDKVISDPIEQGDTVVHAKYGTGIVEKMIKYGTKELFSINFDNVGRRLLDPTLTEIKKA